MAANRRAGRDRSRHSARAPAKIASDDLVFADSIHQLHGDIRVLIDKTNLTLVIGNDVLRKMAALLGAAGGERDENPSTNHGRREDSAQPPQTSLQPQTACPSDSGRLALLTPREREVLALTAHGHSLKEIASHLKRSAGTIARHRANIAHKLGLNDRVALTRFAIRAGIARA